MTARRSASFVVFALAAIAASAAVDAQPAGKVRHIGFIASGSASTGRTLVDAFRVGLRDHGWIEGTNIVVDYRFADGHFDRLPGLADELVRRKVELIVAVPTPTAVAAKNATGSIPVVMASVTDPVEIGLVASLARPGGNVTGVGYTGDVWVKELEILKEALPSARRVALLSNPRNPSHPAGVSRVKAAAVRWG